MSLIIPCNKTARHWLVQPVPEVGGRGGGALAIFKKRKKEEEIRGKKCRESPLLNFSNPFFLSDISAMM